MTNFKTTLSGGLAGICQVVAFFLPGAHILCDPLSALALALMGYFAKDA